MFTQRHGTNCGKWSLGSVEYLESARLHRRNVNDRQNIVLVLHCISTDSKHCLIDICVKFCFVMFGALKPGLSKLVCCYTYSECMANFKPIRAAAASRGFLRQHGFLVLKLL